MNASRRLGWAVCSVLLLASGPAPRAHALVGPEWVPRGIMPYGPHSIGLAYDEARNVAVLFGHDRGSTAQGLGVASTWIWDGVAWTPRETPHAPSPRSNFAMAYDGAVARTVLFGGFFDDDNGVVGSLADTWEWNGFRWIERLPVTRPPARWGGAMAYDASHRKVIMFGGAAGWMDCCLVRLADTWEWDGVNWHARSPATSPPARLGHRMAYDASSGNVVLFGGDGDGGVLNDTWTWDGTTWTQRFPAQAPSTRGDYAMAYDPRRGTVVLHGGVGTLGDTWEWDGAMWTQIDTLTTPGRFAGQSMVFDSTRRELILLGRLFEIDSCGSATVCIALKDIVNETMRPLATWVLTDGELTQALGTP